MCKSNKQWKINGGWGNEFGPEKGWLVGPAGPVGGLVSRKGALVDLPHHSSQGEVHPEVVGRSFAKRAESCPKHPTCAMNEATIGKDKECRKCPLGHQTRCTKYPTGLKPNTVGDKCEKACGAGEARLAGNKCTKYPTGQKPNAAGKKCEKKKDDNDNNKCKASEAQT